jgi:hypothetical protein
MIFIRVGSGWKLHKRACTIFCLVVVRLLVLVGCLLLFEILLHFAFIIISISNLLDVSNRLSFLICSYFNL